MLWFARKYPGRATKYILPKAKYKLDVTSILKQCCRVCAVDVFFSHVYTKNIFVFLHKRDLMLLWYVVTQASDTYLKWIKKLRLLVSIGYKRIKKFLMGYCAWQAIYGSGNKQLLWSNVTILWNTKLLWNYKRKPQNTSLAITVQNMKKKACW